MTETLAVIDFETTGLRPDAGARATEIAVVLVRAGGIVDRYQSLMNAGVRIPPFIESLTGITDAMIRRAPPAAEMTAHLLLHMETELKTRYRLPEVDHALLCLIQRTARSALVPCIERYRPRTPER